ncbi:aspartate kinase [Frigoriflavimonas asaccharolytica]|uniref:Aspartokinase n=1 Tax=Frigoriflavimonas asaccharolytica TaxID=2735899 RepID=A0A8J8G8K4_9FLAO|nr:aspartate kinase [Frigoriflavimonas asaccharolytica]NRS93113.1 aspartate kinase [Frigoriflavimonas asaccharolytica]
MKVFKFGGASVKDANGVKNVATVLKSEGFDGCMLIVSAMGKTTNELEIVIEKYINKENFNVEIALIKEKHVQICSELFEKNHSAFSELDGIFDKIEHFFRENNSTDYNFIYDQIVSFGEIISSKILSLYLNVAGFKNEYLDAKNFIKTDSNFRDGIVNWIETEERIATLNKTQNFVTQGFIGSDLNANTTTLGREGSDYSAAIFAYCLNAEALTIWKDVPGVMTGDPRKFEDTTLLSNISYEEAIEMAYYGASIIHPKTLQPLKQKNIPFFVKSFLKPSEKGTKVSVSEINLKEETYILKENQHLIHISTKDFSFIAENHISLIFNILSKLKIKVSLMQNSAISLALCFDDPFKNKNFLIDELQEQFRLEKIENVSLFTVRNTNLTNIEKFYKNKDILLEQISRGTLQIVAK